MSNNHRSLEDKGNDRMRRGKLDLIHKVCDFCGHDKAFQTINKTKCTRCRREK